MFEDKSPEKTDIASLGEFGLINHLTQYFKINHTSTIKGIGDDCAVLNSDGLKTLVSTDLLVEGVHFNLAYMPLKHLGYKSVMVNLSDVYAMNADAKQITVSIAISNRFPLEAVEELYSGIQLACEKYNIDLIGGDTTSSTKGLLISVTAIGYAEEEKITYRDTAKENDLLIVSGDLGAAYLGFQVLERERQVFEVDPNNQPDLDAYSYLVERQLKPEARKDMVKILNDLDVVPTSMIDISDGLSSEIIHICQQSKVGCNLYEEKIPLDPQVISVCEEFNLNSTTVALSGGEDYELLFTIKQSDFDKIKGNPHITVIGHMTDANSGMNLITRGSNQAVPLTAQGWNSLLENGEES
ncbi:thiamine-phosphate kinase [Wenyingzhuangia sp. IMCC45574]